jgi:hypothetical protein
MKYQLILSEVVTSEPRSKLPLEALRNWHVEAAHLLSCHLNQAIIVFFDLVRMLCVRNCT